MRQDTVQTLARQWTLLRNLPAWPRKATVSGLVEILADRQVAVTRRTVERDLQALSLEFPLTVDNASKPHGWSWARDARQEFTPRLNTSQCVALLLARAHLKTLLPKALLQELVPLFDNAEQEVAISGWKQWHHETAVLQTSLELLPPAVSTDVLEDVQTALAKGRCLSARYRAKGSTTAKAAVIHPLGLLIRGPVQYLVGTMFDYTDILRLPLHRLSHTEVLSEPRKKPVGFDFRKYSAEAASYNPQGTIQLVARFDADAAAHLEETPLSRDQVTRLIDNGERVEVRATVELDETLKWWLLAFGDMVEVVKPAALRRAFAEQTKNLADRYK
jgi:predicted DNA-binding transcriptional regulator YafY